MKLNIWGTIFGESGYAVHTRNLALALHKSKQLDIGLEVGQAPPGYRYFDSRLKEMADKGYVYDNTLMIMTPEWWKLKFSDPIKNLIGFGVFEGDKLPITWERNAKHEKLSCIFTPSEHTKQAFLNSGIEKPIHVIPHGVNPDVFNPDVKPAENVKSDDIYDFLYVGGWRDGILDRKGVDVLIRAYCNEFKKTEKVRLNLKINMSYAKPNQDVSQDINALPIPPYGTRPQMGLIKQNIPENHLARIYKACDCFVMSTKGEAFGMPCLEAAATGLPVIATDYGGQQDYLTQDSNILVKPDGFAPATGGIYYERAKWAIPSVKGFQEQMRYCFDNQEEMRKKAEKNAKHFLENWTWDKTAEKVNKIVKELGDFDG